MVSGSRACLTFILSDHPHRPSRHFDGALLSMKRCSAFTALNSSVAVPSGMVSKSASSLPDYRNSRRLTVLVKRTSFPSDRVARHT
jgi:hypothetical protein